MTGTLPQLTPAPQALLLRPRSWVISALAWSALWLAMGTAVARDLRMQGIDPPLWNVLRQGVITTVLWIAASPMIAAAAVRWPLLPSGWRQHGVRHAVLWLGWVLLATTAGLIGTRLLLGQPLDSSRMFAQFRAGDVALDLLLYGAVLALGVGLHWMSLWQAEQRAVTRLALDNAALEARLVSARLEAVRARMQPHFAGNALNSVAALIRSGESERAIGVLSTVADLIRQTLRDDTAGVAPMERELELVERYLQVERLRFGERMRVAIDAPDTVRTAAVPTMLLQPLVENAVQHGVATTDRPVMVVVRAATRDGRLLLTVEDDGPGLPEGWNAPHSGFGLRAIRERLGAMHGERALLRVEPREGGGVRVAVELPFTLHQGSR